MPAKSNIKIISTTLTAAALALMASTAAHAADDDVAKALAFAYKQYVYVSACHQAREGYLVQYVNGAELERARRAVKAIEQKALKDDPSIDINYVWKWALEHPIIPNRIEATICQTDLMDLIHSSPEPTFNVERP